MIKSLSTKGTLESGMSLNSDTAFLGCKQYLAKYDIKAREIKDYV